MSRASSRLRGLALLLACVPACWGVACGPPAGPPAWVAGLASQDVVQRREAVRTAGEGRAWAASEVRALAQALGDPDRWVREGAAIALREQGEGAAPALQALRDALRDPDEFVRWRSVQALGRLGAAAAPARADVQRHASDPREVEVVRAASQRALERIDAAMRDGGAAR